MSTGKNFKTLPQQSSVLKTLNIETYNCRSLKKDFRITELELTWTQEPNKKTRWVDPLKNTIHPTGWLWLMIGSCGKCDRGLSPTGVRRHQSPTQIIMKM